MTPAPAPSSAPLLPNAERDLTFAVLALQSGQATPEALLTGLHAWLTDREDSLGTILVDQQALVREARSRLDELVARIPVPSTGVESAPVRRSVLRRFMEVCRTLEYAAVGRLGPEPSLVAGPTELGRAVALAREDPMANHRSAGLGVRTFLCPEPVDRNAAPSSHVYGLGVVLYGLLSGKAPFEETVEVAELSERMRRADFWPPRAVQPDAPSALEAVCLKAMQPCPADRYPSVTALADDIDRWLAGEPVTACAETMTQRLTRWGRRHQTVGAATAAGLLALAAALAIALGLAIQDRQRLVQEKEGLLADDEQQAATLRKEQAARRISDNRWLQTRDQLAEQFRRVLHGWLGSQAALTPQQKEYVDGLLNYYRQCTSPNGLDSNSRAGAADAWFQIGVLQQRLGQLKEAQTAFLESERRLNDLVRVDPSDLLLRQKQANGHLHLGALQAADDPTAAEREYRLGVKLLTTLTNEYPPDARLVPPLVASQRQLAAFLVSRGRRRDAINSLQEALATQDKLVGHLDRRPRQRRELSTLHFDLATLQAAEGDQTTARQHFDRALILQRALATEHPNVAEDQYILANMLATLARAASARKDFERATTNVDEALAHSQAAVKAAPNDLHCWMSLSNALTDKAMIQTQVGHYEDAADIAERLLKQPVHSAVDAYNAACALARCASLAEKNAKLSPSQRQQASRDYADRAMKALTRAVASGFRDRAYLTHDPDLGALHSRDDYRRLIASLPAQRNPATGK